MSARTLGLYAGFLVAISAAPAGATPFAYVGSNVGGSASIKVIDTATDTVVATVPMDVAVGGVAVSPDGSRVYVTPYSIKVIDTATNTVTATIPNLGTTFSPRVSPDGTRLYVLNYTGASSDVLQVIDTATNTQVGTVQVGGSTQEMVINPTGTRIYVLRGPGGNIDVVDTATNSVITTITGLDWQLHAAITPDGTKLYTGGRQSAPIAVIDTATNSLATTIPILYGFSGLAMKPDGTRLYATTAGTNTIHVVDVATNTLLTDAPAGCSGGGSIAMNPAGTRAYFHAGDGCDGGVERVFDTASNTVVGAVSVNGPAGSGPTGSGLYIGPFCPNACSDGNPCTTDSCNQISGCIHTYNTGPCASDGNPCTNDVCDGAGMCTHPNSPAGSSCNDGTFCNGPDTCDGAGGCTNHAGDPCVGGPECAHTCNEPAGNCFDLVTTPCTTDGNVCTDDHCNGTGACIHSNNTASCDDGVFCNGTDVCAGGTCTHSGDPCASGPECSRTCNETPHNCLDPAGTPCAPDLNPCSLDQCDGAGACAHPAGNAGAVCRPAAGQCDVAETCTGASTACPADGFKPNGTACDDSNACTTADACSNGACVGGPMTVCPLCETCVAPSGCAVGPKAGCQAVTTPQAAFLELKDGTPSTNHKVTFKWTKGAATSFAQLGNPLTTDDYALCVFDMTGTPGLLLKATAPASGTCAGKACWKQLGSTTSPKGWKYADKDATPDGLTLLQASSGAVGKAKMTVKGKGNNLPVGTFSTLGSAITTQIQAENGTCWTAACSLVTKNAAGDFKCKGE